MNTKKANYLLAFSVLTGLHSYGQETIEDLSEVAFDYNPNILWISVEDIGCNLRPYGDSTVVTPNIERLAREGVVFTNAYATSGICAPSRSTIITGMYSSYMGTTNMRTYGVNRPEKARAFTEYLRDAGYFCANNPKEDYNFSTPDEFWDESGFSAHYYHRGDKSQPFFQVYNILASHESQIWCNNWEHLTVEPDSVRVPLYYPQDNDIIKKDVARKYANIELMDLYVGQKLKMLEDQGILDSTIVVFWSDHGGMMPREKGEVLNSGLKVPLIIRLPNKELAGARSNELVSLMDLGSTMLGLLGEDKPNQMHGRIIMGKGKEEPRKYTFGAMNRIDGANDISRSVTDGRYRYVRNYFPEYPEIEYYPYRFKMRTMQEMQKMYERNELSGYTKYWYQPNKLKELLFDTQTDPDEVVNLAGNPDYLEKLNELRLALNEWQDTIHDVCLMPEAEIFAVQQKYNIPVSDFFDQSPGYYEHIQAMANLALYPEENRKELMKALEDTIPSVRFWAVRGIGRLGMEGKPYYSKLKKLQDDSSLSVRVSLAWTLNKIGMENDALKLYKQIITSEHLGMPKEDEIFYSKVMALNDLMYKNPIANLLEDQLRHIAEKGKYLEKQVAEFVLEEID